MYNNFNFGVWAWSIASENTAKLKLIGLWKEYNYMFRILTMLWQKGKYI